MAGIINQNQLQIVTTQNQMLPREGPIVIPIGPVDLTQNNGQYTLDLSNEQWQNKVSGIQGIFIDASTSGVPVAIKDQGTGHELVANPHTQGFYTFLCGKPTLLAFNGPGGPANFKVFLLNFPVAGVVWAATHP